MTTLYVDLDGTFVKSDLLFESLFSAIKKQPSILLWLPFWLLQGRSRLKEQLALRGAVDYGLIPVNSELQNFLIEEKKIGRRIVLATASDRLHAESIVAAYPDTFDAFLASDGQTNLKSATKLSAIQRQSEHFDYVGNDDADLVILEAAEEKYLANPSRSTLAARDDWNQVFLDQSSGLKTWMKQLRIHQALKNLLIFVPAFLAPMDQLIASIPSTMMAFLSFSMLASATYIFNDLLDLGSDRRHPKKKNRPIAAGNVSIASSLGVMSLLLVVSIALAVVVGGGFLLVLLTYLATTLSYSFVLKEYIGIDTITLAGLFTVRIFAGAEAAQVSLSFWILAFSMLVFFSLALVKRCAELRMLEAAGESSASGRDYNVEDYNLLQSLGTSTGMLAVLVFAFYTQSSAFLDQYQEPSFIWLALPALSYWIFRMWMKTNRGEMDSDPIVFSLTDRGSYIALGFVAATFVLERTA